MKKMKKNTIKVLMVCLSILFSLACVDYFTCVDAHCEDSAKGYWDPSGQYHAFPPEKERTPEDKEDKGDVSLLDLSNYVTTQVKRKSIVANGKSQTPTISVSPALGDKWKDIKLK